MREEDKKCEYCHNFIDPNGCFEHFFATGPCEDFVSLEEINARWCGGRPAARGCEPSAQAQPAKPKKKAK